MPPLKRGWLYLFYMFSEGGIFMVLGVLLSITLIFFSVYYVNKLFADGVPVVNLFLN